MSENMLPKTGTPSWQIVLMFFIAFYGILAPVWIFFMCCGYPHWSIGGLPITANNIVRGIQAVSVLFFGYIVVRTFRIEGFKGFPGMSIPLALLLVALFVRQVFDFLYLRDHFGPRVLGLLSFNIMLLAFSIRYNNQSLSKAMRYGVFIPALILAGIMLFTWSDYFTDGLTARSRDFKSNEVSVSECIERSTDQDHVAQRSSIPLARTFLMVGSVIGLFVVTLIESKKIRYFFIFPVHICGTSLILFTSYRTFFLAYLGTCLFVLIISLLRQFRESGLNKGTLKTVLFIVTIIVADIFLACTIGFNDRQSMAARIQLFMRTHTRYQADVQTFISSIGTDVTQIKPDTYNDSTIVDDSEDGDISKVTDSSKIISLVEAANKLAVTNEQKDQKRSIVKSSMSDKSNNKSIESSSLVSSVLYESPYSSLKSKKIRYLKDEDFRYLCKLMGIKDPRLAQIKLAIDLIKQHPYLGYSSIFVVNLKGEPVRMLLHSNILIIFLALGIVGGSLFLYIVFWGFVHAIRIVFYDVRLALLPAFFFNDFLVNLINTHVLQCVWLFVPLVVMRSIVKSQIIKNNTASNQKNKVKNL